MVLRLMIFIIVFLSAISVYGQASGRKKNQRPTATPSPSNQTSRPAGKPVYFYEFEKPEFLISKVQIEHDEEGLGQITFEKMKLEESFTRPLELSPATTELLKEHWENLEFLSSTEEYQSKNAYPHLGLMRLKMVGLENSRKVEFDWTDNVDAKALTAEYKKIGYEYVWKFEIEVARKNQPLESPRMMKQIDSYVKRNEISDPKHIVPYLIELSADERIPLIARNHAKRIAELINKKKR